MDITEHSFVQFWYIKFSYNTVVLVTGEITYFSCPKKTLSDKKF